MCPLLFSEVVLCNLLITITKVCRLHLFYNCKSAVCEGLEQYLGHTLRAVSWPHIDRLSKALEQSACEAYNLSNYVCEV